MKFTTTKVRWPKAHRIISTRHPPVDLFEDISNPDDWELLVSLEQKTNPRILQQVGNLSLVPKDRRVSGPGASYVMALFLHVSPRWAGRFHDGSFGAYYAANSFETAVAETTYHRAMFFKAAGEDPGWFCEFVELVGKVNDEFIDLRDADGTKDLLLPDDYTAAQSFARQCRAEGANGIVYPSVRDEGGECIAAFWPDVIGVPVRARVLEYHFDGEKIDYVRNSTDAVVYRL